MRWTQSSGGVNDILAKLYKKKFGSAVISFSALYAHGSDRDIIRLTGNNGHTAIGIHNSSIPENNAFINFSEHFKKKKLNVPEIYSVSNDTKSYLMEDLGDTTLLKKLNSSSTRFSDENVNHYKNVITQLVKFQTGAGKSVDYGLCYQFKEFGKENIEFDLQYFKQRFLAPLYKKIIENEKLENDLKYLKSKLLEPGRNNFLYRDFQSRNIMLYKDDLYFIDYQSGRKGALQYDLASLLYDARADIPQHLREEFIDFYIETVNKNYSVSPDEFKFYFWYFAVIRILQAMGAYGYLGITKGKTRFLESIPYALKNINFILGARIENGKLDYLKKIFTEINYEAASN